MQTVGEEGWASQPHTLPMAITGMHPLRGSGPQPTMWPPSVTETKEMEHCLVPKNKRLILAVNVEVV